MDTFDRTAVVAAVAAAAAFSSFSSAAAEPPPAAEQIAGAVLAAPEAQRGGAGVLGYDAEGNLSLLRTGTNELLCLADDPAQEGFQAACYHRALEPFMARGRALRAEGVTSGLERTARRWKEIEAGELSMPEQPTTLHLVQGDAFDPSSGEITNPYRRWVVYVPYATAESTGLPTAAAPGVPWLMMPGTPSAHIMISPPRP